MALNIQPSTTFAVIKDPFAFEQGVSENESAEKFRQLAEEYFGETDENRQDRILQLEERLRLSSPGLLKNVPGSKEEFLLKILRAGAFDVDCATNLLHRYVSMIQSAPKYFKPAFDVKLASVRFTLEQNFHTILPHRDKFGRRVFIFRPGKWNPDVLSFNNIFSCVYALGEMVAREDKTQIAGVTVICDANGFALKQFKSLSFADFKQSAMFVQDHFPLWYRSIHVMNCPRLAHAAYQMLKPLLKPRVKDAILFHDSNESLYQHVDKSILPQELGGHAGPFDCSESSKAVLDMTDYFGAIENFVFESNRCKT